MFPKFLVLSEGAAEALALWTLHTHAHDAARISPILAVTSPQKRCGKTKTLDVLGPLVRRPLPASPLLLSLFLGVVIREGHGMIYLDGENLRGGDVQLDFPSVGATENVMMAGVLARGVTRIQNAAREPEIADLERFINALGGKVSGAGSDTITVVGVDSLGGAKLLISPKSSQ